jgi:hypothetical protein
MNLDQIKRLAYSYHDEPTLCVMGEHLNRHRWLWRLYSFLSVYTTPKYRINDLDDTDTAVIFVVNEMLADINEVLLPMYGMTLVLGGGNLYLQKAQ